MYAREIVMHRKPEMLAGPPQAKSELVTPDILAHLAGRTTHSPGAESVEVSAPVTGHVIGRVPVARPADVASAAVRARAAQAVWASTPLKQRARIVLRFHDLVLDRREIGRDLVSLETGKVRLDAFEETFDTAATAQHYVHSAPNFLAPRRRRGALPLVTRTVEYRQPLGVVGFIMPMHYPLVLGITDAIPALLAGNAVIVKPDPHTPYSVLWAATLLDEAGLDPELVHIVVGEGEDLGGALIGEVDYLMFTGSTRTGRLVARQCADRLIGCSLELGSKNAMIVLDDADLGRTTSEAVRACFVSAGQLCVHAERIYLPESRFTDFADAFVARVRTMRLGGGDADMGPLTSPRQLQSVEAQVDDAVAKGATVLAGGRARPDIGPYFYEPTVLSDVTPEMAVYANETFGPVVSLYPYRDEVDAIQQANASRFGLSFSVWTTDIERGRRVARQLYAGSVNINEGYGAAWASTDAPMGGVKESGFGRRHGAEGILQYTVSQTVAVQHLVPLSPPAWMPESIWEMSLVAVLKLRKRLGNMGVRL